MFFSSNASKIPHKLNFSHTDYTATSNHDLKNEIVSDLFHFLPPMVLYKLTETNIEEGIVLLKTRILQKNGAILAKLFVEVIADISNIEKSRTGEILKEKNERIERMNSQDMDDYVQKGKFFEKVTQLTYRVNNTIYYAVHSHISNC